MSSAVPGMTKCSLLNQESLLVPHHGPNHPRERGEFRQSANGTETEQVILTKKMPGERQSIQSTFNVLLLKEIWVWRNTFASLRKQQSKYIHKCINMGFRDNGEWWGLRHPETRCPFLGDQPLLSSADGVALRK